MTPVQTWNHRCNPSYWNKYGWYPAGHSYLMARRCLLSLGWPLFLWWCHKKIPYGVNILSHQPALNLIFFYWVGYNLIWIIRSVETDLGDESWWKLWLIMMLILFLVFTDLTCHLKGKGIFWTLPHHVFTSHHSCSWYVLIRLQCFHHFKIFIIITHFIDLHLWVRSLGNYL